MRMRHVDARERETHPVHAVQALHVASQLLAQVEDMARQIGRHVLVVGIVLLGDDQRMPWAHGLDVEKGQEALVLVDDVRGDLVAGDAAEQTVIGHAGLGENRLHGGACGSAGSGRWPQYR
ncbi:hypothetical protein D9M70_560280 [compost metagenome]